MKKLLHNNTISYINAKGILPKTKGGTGHDSSVALIAELGAVPLGSKNEPLGVAGLDGNNNIPTSLLSLPDSNPGKSIIQGVTNPQAKKTTLYTITNYSNLDSYVISSTRGTVTRSGSTITYKGPLTEGADNITINGQVYSLAVRTPVTVNKPSIISPANGASDDPVVRFQSGPFTTSNGVDNHVSSQWQLATDSSFTNIVKDEIGTTTWSNQSTDGAWLGIWNVSGLTRGVTYYARVKYTGSPEADASPWSDTTGVLIVKLVNPTIVWPGNGSAGHGHQVTFHSSAFATTLGNDTHVASHWELATDPNFNSIVASSYNNTTNKTSITFNTPNRGWGYFIRVAHIGALGGATPWSPNGYGVITVAISQPWITSPANGSGGFDGSIPLWSSGFSTVNGTGGDTHISSTWQLATDPGFGNVIAGTYNDPNAKNFWQPGGLAANTTYYARVRHEGAAAGAGPFSSTNYYTTVTWFPWTPTHVGVEDTGSRAFTLFGVYSGVLSSAAAVAQRDQMNANGYAYTEFQAEWTDGYVEGRNSVTGLIAGNYTGVRVYDVTAENGFGYPPSSGRSVRFRCRAHTHDGRVSQWSAWGGWIGAG